MFCGLLLLLFFSQFLMGCFVSVVFFSGVLKSVGESI